MIPLLSGVYRDDATSVTRRTRIDELSSIMEGKMWEERRRLMEEDHGFYDGRYTHSEHFS